MILFKDEFYQLFAALFRKSENYVAIVRALAARGSGLMRQKLLDRNVVSDGKELTKCLIELEQCGFIRKHGGYEDGKNKCLFQLIDSLSLFHFSFLDVGDDLFL